MKAKTHSKKEALAEQLNQQTMTDIKNSAIVLSLFANLFIFTTWLVLEATEEFNSDVIAYLQG
ncbi:hypothetical protein CYG49_04155 [Candidatus Saccharibacteria bacterium]|nr:MAG: hypothetical protein CYG49_04155 [Candidatus Saccharibacteria bacterium]